MIANHPEQERYFPLLHSFFQTKYHLQADKKNGEMHFHFSRSFCHCAKINFSRVAVASINNI